MRVSIWQQFSSNNSASFTVVGVFQDSEAVEKAITSLTHILKTIRDWHQENPEKSEAWYESWDEKSLYENPTEIEIELGKQYGLAWRGGIDWYADYEIKTFDDRFVLLESTSQCYSSPEPFNLLMEWFGGVGMMVGHDFGGKPFGEIKFLLTCEAPDETIAAAIVQEKSASWVEVRQFDRFLAFDWTYESAEFYFRQLIPYLKRKGCRQIDYHLEGKNYVRTSISVPDEDAK